MAQPNLQPADDSALALPTPQPASTLATLTNFWSHFRALPLNFDNYSFNHWYLYTIGTYIVLGLLAVLLDLRFGFLNHHDPTFYFSYAFSHSLTKVTLFDWQEILEIIGISLTALVFNHWRQSIPGTFQTLLSKERIASSHQGDDIHQEYLQFLEQYQRMLLSKKRYFLIVGIVMISMLPTLILTWRSIYYLTNPRYDPLFGRLYFIYILFNAPLAVLLEAYFFAVGCWSIAVTGTYIKRLTKQFDLHIVPGHPDNCGGLKILGDFCLGMAFPVLIIAMFLGIFGIGGLLVKDIYLLTIIANVFLFLFVLPLAGFTFFVPLWNIHRKMVERRDAYEDQFAERQEQLQQRIQLSLDKHEMADAKAAREELEMLQVLHPDKISYPVWPFDRPTLLKFLAPQIIPLLSLLSGLLGPLAEALRR